MKYFSKIARYGVTKKSKPGESVELILYASLGHYANI